MAGTQRGSLGTASWEAEAGVAGRGGRGLGPSPAGPTQHQCGEPSRWSAALADRRQSEGQTLGSEGLEREALLRVQRADKRGSQAHRSSVPSLPVGP